MAEMVTVGGIRFRSEDAAREGFTADSKAHQKLIAEGKAPTGVSEAIWKASQKDTPARKAAGKSTGAPAPVASSAGATAPAGATPAS